MPLKDFLKVMALNAMSGRNKGVKSFTFSQRKGMALSAMSRRNKGVKSMI